MHILNLGCSCITLRELCINQQPRCDIAGLHVSNIYTTVSRVKRLSNFVLNKLFKTVYIGKPWYRYYLYTVKYVYYRLRLHRTFNYYRLRLHRTFNYYRLRLHRTFNYYRLRLHRTFNYYRLRLHRTFNYYRLRLHRTFNYYRLRLNRTFNYYRLRLHRTFNYYRLRLHRTFNYYRLRLHRTFNYYRLRLHRTFNVAGSRYFFGPKQPFLVKWCRSVSFFHICVKGQTSHITVCKYLLNMINPMHVPVYSESNWSSDHIKSKPEYKTMSPYLNNRRGYLQWTI